MDMLVTHLSPPSGGRLPEGRDRPARRRRAHDHGLRTCLGLSCLLLACLLLWPTAARAADSATDASLSRELEQLDLSSLPVLPPLPDGHELPAAAPQAPGSAPPPDPGNTTGTTTAAGNDGDADAALPETPRWQRLEDGLCYAEFTLPAETGPQALLTVLRIDPERFDFRLYASAAHQHPPLTLAQWADTHDLVAAINASMYLPDGVTSTGYMRQDDYINNKRLVRRFGAFFVAGPRQAGLPRADILDRETPRWQELLDEYRLVIQNYRMISGERRILWSPGGPLYAISAVAEDGDGQILFLHCRDPLEAYSFAHALLHLPLDVRTVMYVEGGMQAGLVIRSPGLHQELRGRHLADFWVTGNVRAQLPNVLGIRRRPAASAPHATPAASSMPAPLAGTAAASAPPSPPAAAPAESVPSFPSAGAAEAVGPAARTGGAPSSPPAAASGAAGTANAAGSGETTGTAAPVPAAARSVSAGTVAPPSGNGQKIPPVPSQPAPAGRITANQAE